MRVLVRILRARIRGFLDKLVHSSVEQFSIASMEQLKEEIGGLKKLLDSLTEENHEMKREINELRKVCAQGERVHHSEMLTFKKDLERLKKTQPDLNPGGQSSNTTPPSPDIYTRIKGPKRRPQSVHEISILPPSMQGQLQADKIHENGSNGNTVLGVHFVGTQPPFYFTLYNFEHHKKNKLKWFSAPFYSHCNGYKMCIAVDAAGSSVGEGTHVSINVHLLPGEYDDTLPWPLRGTVQLQILNERKDGNHFESAVDFTEDTPFINSARVTGRDMSTGWGNAMLIRHSDLGVDSTKDCEFLKYDRLRFAVSNVELAH